jgi:hypothetical protein
VVTSCVRDVTYASSGLMQNKSGPRPALVTGEPMCLRLDAPVSATEAALRGRCRGWSWVCGYGSWCDWDGHGASMS